MPAWTLIVSNALPAAPALSTPLNAWVTNGTTPTFTWAGVTNAVSYRIQIDTVSSFIHPVLDETLTDGSLTYTPTAFADSNYFWRVAGINQFSLQGAWSGTRSFTIDTTPPTIPTLNSPADGTTVRGTPTYKWSAPAGANAYQFEYAADSAFTSPVYTSPVLTSTTFVPPTQSVNTYYWHVKARDAVGNWSLWSTTPRSIIIWPVIPAAPALTTPLNATSTNSTSPQLTWGSVPDGNTYQLQVSKVSTFKTTVQDATLDPAVLTSPATTSGDGTYYWRVRAINVKSESGAWSATRSFIIDTTAPAVPSLSSPADSAVLQTTTPALSVASVSGAKYYQFQIAATNDFATPLLDVTPTSTSYTPTTAQALPFGTLYWRAQSIDSAGNPSGWSTTRSFIVNILKSPANSSYTTSQKPAFSWAAAAGALQYRLQVDTLSDFSSTTKALDITLNPSTSYTSTTALPNSLYYWHLLVKTASGWSNSTPAFSFTITPTSLAAPVLNTPVSGFLFYDNTPSLAWKTVSGSLSAYEIQISTSSDFTTTVTDAQTVSGITSYTSTALSDGKYYWRVKAIFKFTSNTISYDLDGPWSSSNYFTIKYINDQIPNCRFGITAPNGVTGYPISTLGVGNYLDWGMTATPRGPLTESALPSCARASPGTSQARLL